MKAAGVKGKIISGIKVVPDFKPGEYQALAKFERVRLVWVRIVRSLMVYFHS